MMTSSEFWNLQCKPCYLNEKQNISRKNLHNTHIMYMKFQINQFSKNMMLRASDTRLFLKCQRLTFSGELGPKFNIEDFSFRAAYFIIVQHFVKIFAIYIINYLVSCLISFVNPYEKKEGGQRPARFGTKTIILQDCKNQSQVHPTGLHHLSAID